MITYLRDYLFTSNNVKLIEVLSKRNFESRYKGSILGGLWSLLNPLIMMLIYTFVFSFVLKAKWGGDREINFSIMLYSGLIIFIACSEIIMTSVSCVRDNVNYVKKIVFPLEILPIVNMVVSYINFIISLIILEVFHVLVMGTFSIDVIYLSVLVIPLFILSLGIGYFLASLSVYVKDLIILMGFVTSIMLFLSPVFYPLSNIPEAYVSLMYLNPITYIVEFSRDVIFFNWIGFNFIHYILYFSFSMLVFGLGLWWFKLTKRGFADVL